MCLIGRYDRMVYYPRFLDSMGAGDDHTSLFPERIRIHTFVFFGLSVYAPRSECPRCLWHSACIHIHLQVQHPKFVNSGQWILLLLEFSRDVTFGSSCRI